MSKDEKKKKNEDSLQGTHTLRHVLESNPGGRFPLKIGSTICRVVIKCKNTRGKKMGKKG